MPGVDLHPAASERPGSERGIESPPTIAHPRGKCCPQILQETPSGARRKRGPARATVGPRAALPASSAHLPTSRRYGYTWASYFDSRRASGPPGWFGSTRHSQTCSVEKPAEAVIPTTKGRRYLASRSGKVRLWGWIPRRCAPRNDTHSALSCRASQSPLLDCTTERRNLGRTTNKRIRRSCASARAGGRLEWRLT